MIENSLYYEYPDYKLHNDKYPLYLCEGQRGRGKTTWWLQQFVVDAYNTGNKFVYLRRSEVEMQLALEKGLYNGVQTVSYNKPFWANIKATKEKAGNLYLITQDNEEVHVGYYMTLNNVKGVSIEDADKLLFDEYIAETRSKYKGGDSGLNEPMLFMRLLETIFRRRKFCVVMLGNSDTPSNPYNEFWRVPFKTQLYKNKNNGIWYEYDYSELTAEHKETTALGIISRGTKYSDYSQGLKALNEMDDSLLSDKPSHSEQLYNVRILGSLLTVWIDRKNGVLYYTDKCKINTAVQTISVTNSDMSVNTDFIRYCVEFLMIMKAIYGKGSVRFNNQKTASLFTAMLSIQ